ncbi:MAG: hypothetical protein ACTSQ0_04070, partial [Candidatus Heimdallarchaeota archaeon]
MKCVYHPMVESDNRCDICNVPICKTCTTEAELDNSGACHACTRQGKIAIFYKYFRIASCGVGGIWLVVAMLIFTTVPFLPRISYGIYGLLGAFVLNFLAAFILTRMMI